ncbi:Nucleic acid-binding [Vigna unguiculata]|uniref:Nucleic acid-binding n=1 Tax=Vigna unguiculata TaxID=3917 RepID=A0A4D6MGZ0_VIGUN|nr:Nucleic acid-binding [Vigna unguiculata]
MSLRYKLRLRVIDATDSTTFVVFDRDASAMLKKSCSDILDLQDKDLLIKLTEESNDVETLSDHLSIIGSSHVDQAMFLQRKH